MGKRGNGKILWFQIRGSKIQGKKRKCKKERYIEGYREIHTEKREKLGRIGEKRKIKWSVQNSSLGKIIQLLVEYLSVLKYIYDIYDIHINIYIYIQYT